MKLLRYGPAGFEKPGLLDSTGAIRDLSGVVDHVTSEHLSAKELARLAKIKPESLPRVSGTPRLGVPYLGISKFIAIGLNYADHAAESGVPVPSEPILFSKATTCINGPNDDIVIPRNSTKTDWEVELGVVIGTKAQYVAKDKALDHVAGYCVINDVSERNFQLERGSQWDRGKGCDTFGPIGPWLVTRDEVPDPQSLDMWLDVNGQRDAAWQHAHDDLRRGTPRELRQPVHDAAAGRHHHDRHAAGGRHGTQAAAIPEGRRRRDARHRRAR